MHAIFSASRRVLSTLALAGAASAAVLWFGPAPALAEGGGRPRFLVWDRDSLELTRAKWRANDPSIAAPRATLQAAAYQALFGEPYSVARKSIVPPSGDKRDFFSYGSYWWPDPNSPTGIPWVPRDGMINPDAAVDYDQLNPLIDDLNALGLAYFFTDDELYAGRAAALLRAFFIDPNTAMNPRVLYAQTIPGVSDGACDVVGWGYALRAILDVAGLLERSVNWSADDKQAMNAWCAAFFQFLRTHPKAVVQALEPSNHGSNYDWVTAALAYHVGDLANAKNHILTYRVARMPGQISLDGSNPLEMLRADNYLYHRFNFDVITYMARLSERLDAPSLWTYQLADGRGPRLALDFMLPYYTGEQQWTYWPGEPFPISWLHNYITLRIAAVGYRDAALLDAAATAYPEGPGGTLWVNLTHPAGMVAPSRVMGDLNGDGLVNFADIDPFIAAIAGPDVYYAAYSGARRFNGDFNGDENVDFADIEAFVARLAAGQ